MTVNEPKLSLNFHIPHGIDKANSPPLSFWLNKKICQLPATATTTAITTTTTTAAAASLSQSCLFIANNIVDFLATKHFKTSKVEAERTSRIEAF
ncbi:hypothetical protein ACLKA6_018550 [Drosophila palustris]